MKLTIKGHIFAKQESWETKPQFTFFDFEATDAWVKVAPHEIIVEVPDNFDVRPGLVANLEREKEKLSAEFNARVMQINQQIQSLLAIENNPSAPAVEALPF